MKDHSALVDVLCRSVSSKLSDVLSSSRRMPQRTALRPGEGRLLDPARWEDYWITPTGRDVVAGDVKRHVKAAKDIYRSDEWFGLECNDDGERFLDYDFNYDSHNLLIADLPASFPFIAATRNSRSASFLASRPKETKNKKPKSYCRTLLISWPCVCGWPYWIPLKSWLVLDTAALHPMFFQSF